jgi:hypothetical protein
MEPVKNELATLKVQASQMFVRHVYAIAKTVDRVGAENERADLSIVEHLRSQVVSWETKHERTPRSVHAAQPMKSTA